MVDGEGRSNSFITALLVGPARLGLLVPRFTSTKGSVIVPFQFTRSL